MGGCVILTHVPTEERRRKALRGRTASACQVRDELASCLAEEPSGDELEGVQEAG